MEAKHVRTLMEAYASVYGNDEQIDEGITSVVKSSQDKAKGPAPTSDRPRIKMGPGEGGRFPKKKTPHTTGGQKMKEESSIDEGIMNALKRVGKAVLGPADQSPEAEAARKGKRRPQTKQEKSVAAGTVNKEDVDVFDVVKGYLMTEHDVTEEEALKVMLELTDDERQSILELNLPRSVTVIPPSGPKGDQRMYKAGGGDAAMNQKGQTRDQVIQQGRKNYVKQRGAAAREDIKRQDAGKVGKVNGQIPEFRVK